MRLELLGELNAARADRRAVAVETRIADGVQRLIHEGALPADAHRDDVETAFRLGRSRVLETAEGPAFLNVYLPPPRLVVIGAVHISQALAPMAGIAGYDVTIIDPRTAFATAARFGEIDLIAEWPEPALRAHPLDQYTALAALTHDPKIDDFPIAAALRAGCFYVGALGSRKTHAKRLERLGAEGLSADLLRTIEAPIGLDIGAASPGEIAVSVLAGVIAAFRRRGSGEGRGRS